MRLLYVFGASTLLLRSTVRMDKMMQDCVCHLFPAPVPLCGATGVLQGILGLRTDSIWALVHINSFKCHYKIHGAFYWLSWCSEVCLVHWVGVTLFLFFIKVWIRRERELTSERDTSYKFSSVTCRVRNKPQFLQNHMEWEEMAQTVSAAEAGTV